MTRLSPLGIVVLLLCSLSWPRSGAAQPAGRFDYQTCYAQWSAPNSCWATPTCGGPGDSQRPVDGHLAPRPGRWDRVAGASGGAARALLGRPDRRPEAAGNGHGPRRPGVAGRGPFAAGNARRRRPRPAALRVPGVPGRPRHPDPLPRGGAGRSNGKQQAGRGGVGHRAGQAGGRCPIRRFAGGSSSSRRRTCGSAR